MSVVLYNIFICKFYCSWILFGPKTCFFTYFAWFGQNVTKYVTCFESNSGRKENVNLFIGLKIPV